MTNPAAITQRVTDTAVLEQRYGDVWRPLTYIGPDRPDMVFMPKTVLKGGSMRIRYL